MCILLAAIASLLFLSWAAVGSWIFWDVRWNWWNASPDAWTTVRRRFDAWKHRWLALLGAATVGAAVAGAHGC